MQYASTNAGKNLGKSEAEGTRLVSLRFGAAILLFLTAFLMLAAAARAQTYGGQGGNSQWHEFQHARRAACTFKSVGSVCTFALQGQQYSGSCQPSQQGQMVCRNAVSHQGLNSHSPIYNGLSVGVAPNY